MRRLALGSLWLLLLSACPPINSTPCSDDSQCRADQRCRRGACGPICLDDTDCGDTQVCLADGTCGARPECANDAECANGFVCTQGHCTCEDDSACAANQQCTNGTCQTRPRCTADADCRGTGARCEVTQGLCLPVCNMPQDCAPTLDPRLAFALYTCSMGTCTRRCTQDLQCGGQSLICRNGLCTKADCAQASDCPAGQYCTSATFGRCEAYTTCTNTSQCMRNYECKTFPENQCPPGFDCSQSICRELQRCLADGDCVSGVPGTMGSEPTGYCEEGHCQPSPTCVVNQQCGTGKTCIGGVCVPSVCRGHLECGGSGHACVDGACVTPPAPADIDAMRLSPLSTFVVEGDAVQLHLIVFRIDGTTYPLESATFTVRDTMGMPSTNATVSSTGLLLAVMAGEVRVRATVTGSSLMTNEVAITIIPRVMMGRRVIVTDAATGGPLENVAVRACPMGDCTSPTDVMTTAQGIAEFPLLDGSATTFTAVPSSLRTDGLPAFERASILTTGATDVLIPLRENPVKNSAGFSASISFSDVSTVGSYWAGFVTASASDVPSVTAQGLLGENFQVEIPGIGQQVPVPGALVLYTSPGLGFPQEVKPRSLSFAQPGTRFVQAWAGRAYLESAFALRSVDVLSYLGAFDYAQLPGIGFTAKPWVADATDVDSDGLCSNMTKCPMGSEDVPDYARFTQLSFQPRRQQKLRTEVVLQKVPSTFDTVLFASALFDERAGMLPTGFASKTPGMVGNDGQREVEPVIVRGGPAYNGLETATPGIWVLAGNAGGTASSARLLRSSVLGSKVLVTPLLPAPAMATYTPGNRTLNPGQPAWSSVLSTGGELGRVALTGTDTRHVIYFQMAMGQSAIVWPSSPTGPGQDPAAQAMTKLEVVAVDLISGVSVEQVFDSAGVTLGTWAQVIDGYSRLDR